jgi:hypothetical protein
MKQERGKFCFFFFFYQVVNTLSDCATAKATNAATRGRLVTASYCDFTIFAALAAVTARARSAAAAPVATISRYGLLLLLSNLNYSQTLKPTSPWKLAGDENSSIHRSHTQKKLCLCLLSVCVSQIHCHGELQIEMSGQQRERGWIGAWNFAAMAREEDHTALRARFLTSSGFLSHKDLSKRNCCVKWKFLKVKRLLRKRDYRK